MRKRNSPSIRKQNGKQSTSKPQFVVSYIPEPKLEFAYGQKLEYPRDGLFLFGPCDATKVFSATRFGVIGTSEGVERFQRWSKRMRGYIAAPVPGPRSREIEPQHVAFPGFKEAFHSEWPEKPIAVIDDLTVAEIKEKIFIQNRHEAIHGCVDIFVSRLVREENRLEAPPSFWFVVIPEVVYELGRPQSRVPRTEALQGEVTISQKKALDLKMNPTLFGEDEDDADIYEYATHFRRQMKARLLKHRIVTQIVRETTLAPDDFKKANGMPLRRLEDPATVAWKLGTGAYYKGGRQAMAARKRSSRRLLCGTCLQADRANDGCATRLLCGPDVSDQRRRSGVSRSSGTLVPCGYEAIPFGRGLGGEAGSSCDRRILSTTQ